MTLEHTKDGTLLKRVMKNSFALMVAKVIDALFTILIMAIVARYLGAENFGTYAFVMTIGALAAPLVDIGIRRIVIREMSKNLDNAAEYLGTALFIRGASTVFLILSGTIFWVFSASETTYLLLLAVLCKILLNYEMVLTGVLNAYEKMGYETIITVVRDALNLLLLLLVVFLNLNIMGVVLVIVISNSIGAILAYYIVRKKFITTPLKVSFERCKVFLKEAYPLAIYAFILVLFYKIDILFLKYYRSNYEIGLYQVASQFALAWNIIPMSLSSSLFPSFSRSAVVDRERFAGIYKKAFTYMLIIGLTIVLAILYLTEDILLIVYGHDFLAASPALKIYAWCILLVFFNIILNTILTAIGKQAYNTLAAIICLSVNIILDFFLVPNYGYIGACYATLVSFITLFLVTFYHVKKFVISASLIDIIWKPAVSVIIPILLLFLVKGSNIFVICYFF